MKLKIYKTKEFEGEVISTPEVEMELNINELRVSSKAIKKLTKVVKRRDLNTILNTINSGEINEFLINKLYDLVEDSDDNLLLFIRFVMVESGFYVTCDQIESTDAEDKVRLLFLMFRLDWDKFKSSIRIKFTTKEESDRENIQG